MSRASWIFIFIVLFVAIGASHAGEGWLSFFAVLIADGGLAFLWIASATMLGAVLLGFTRIALPSSLRFSTAAGLGLGIYSLAALTLGLAGLLNRPTALALPILSILLFLARQWPRIRATSFNSLRLRAES